MSARNKDPKRLSLKKNHWITASLLSCGHILHKQFFPLFVLSWIFFSLYNVTHQHDGNNDNNNYDDDFDSLIETQIALIDVFSIDQQLMRTLFFSSCVSFLFCWYQNSCLFFWIKIKVHSVRIKNVDVSWKMGFLFSRIGSWFMPIIMKAQTRAWYTFTEEERVREEEKT